jgi:hypothetical protein
MLSVFSFTAEFYISKSYFRFTRGFAKVGFRYLSWLNKAFANIAVDPIR